MKELAIAALILGGWLGLSILVMSWCAASGQADVDSERMTRIIAAEAERRRQLRAANE